MRVLPIYLRIACFINLLKDCVDFWKVVLEGKASHVIWRMRLKLAKKPRNFNFAKEIFFDFAEFFFIFFEFIILVILVDFDEYCISLHTKNSWKIHKKVVKKKIAKLGLRNSFLGIKKVIKKIVNFFWISRNFFP